MSLLKYIFISTLLNYYFINIIYGKEDVCNLIEEKSPHLRLKRHLFCNYDSNVRPTNNLSKNKTSIKIIVIPKLIEFDDSSNVMKLHCWMYMVWKDINLQWKPEEFDGIDDLYIPSYELWTPDITVVNSGIGDQEVGIAYTNCVLSSSGEVVCVPAVCYSTRCKIDSKHWPFDKKYCSFQYSSWSHNKDEVEISADSFQLQMFHFIPNAEWKLDHYDIVQVQKKSKYISQLEFSAVSIDFLVEHENSVLWRIFVSPLIVVVTMTLTTTWLDPASNERLIIAFVNFIVHFICLSHLHWQLSSAIVPNILMFYHNSMILATVALILTCFSRKLTVLKTSPPLWISSTISKILVNKYGQVLLPLIFDLKATAKIVEDGDDSSDLIDSEISKKSNWNDVIILSGWITLFCFIFIYIIMFAIFIHDS